LFYDVNFIGRFLSASGFEKLRLHFSSDGNISNICLLETAAAAAAAENEIMKERKATMMLQKL
jgi:hypothetical protein